VLHVIITIIIIIIITTIYALQCLYALNCTPHKILSTYIATALLRINPVHGIYEAIAFQHAQVSCIRYVLPPLLR